MARSRSWLPALLLLGSLGAAVLGWRVIRRSWARLRPGATLVLAIDSAHPFEAGVSPADARRRTLEALRGRVEKVVPTALVSVDGDRVEVLLPRSAPPEPVAHLLTRTGRLELKLVDDGAVYMDELAAAAIVQPGDAVRVEHDHWTEKDSGAAHDDPFLWARAPDVLERALSAALATAPLPAGHQLALEERHGADGDVRWRTYYLFARAEVSGDDIEDADATWDQQTGRPEVSLHLDAAGAKALEALTARAVGRKLAILLEGRVNSAPIIEGKIAGGNARISMGGATDPFQLQSEAKDLVAILRTGATAAPVSLVAIRPPPGGR